MSNRIYILLLLLLSASGVYADKNVSVGNVDTADSFEVTAPDGMMIHEYDTNLPDSIPYLIEHARWREPRAYEALAECYRHGKGGVEKSMFNAMMSYGEAGRSVSRLAENAYEADPSDELGLINHLMEGLNKGRLEEHEVMAAIDAIPSPAPQWASLLKEILQRPVAERPAFIESRLSGELTPDEIIIGCGYLAMIDDDTFDEMFIDIKKEDRRKIIRKFGEKIPPLYDHIGDKLWRKYYSEEMTDEDFLADALTIMYRADQAGFLSERNMVRILTYCEEHGKDDKILFSDEDLARFDKICPKTYRDFINSPVVDVEEVIAVDECPDNGSLERDRE